MSGWYCVQNDPLRRVFCFLENRIAPHARHECTSFCGRGLGRDDGIEDGKDPWGVPTPRKIYVR
ncbi:hypothetical protein PSCICN_31930 [Pseudomonas cichorii]|nr:hypothetical protein PSCICN_31930 [Pseudomonas cichorii]